MKYSTTKAIVNKIVPGTFRNGVSGIVPQAGAFRSGTLGRLGDSTGVSLSTDMMMGLALGAVGVVLWCKHKHKIQGARA